MATVTRDIKLDQKLFDFLESPAPPQDLDEVRVLVMSIAAQDRDLLLRVIAARSRNLLTREECEELADNVCHALMKQVLRQLGGEESGLILSREASESVFKWECAKLGNPLALNPKKRGLMGNFMRALGRRRTVEYNDERHAPTDAREVENALHRKLETGLIHDMCEGEYRAADGFILSLWVHSWENGLTTSRVIEIAAVHGVRTPAKTRIRRALRNAARDQGFGLGYNPDKLPVFKLTYLQLVDLASSSVTTRGVSLSKVQKLVSSFKRRVREELTGKRWHPRGSSLPKGDQRESHPRSSSHIPNQTNLARS